MSHDSGDGFRVSLFSELKRRNVFRVAIAYLALAWLLTEVAGTVFPVFGIPEWGVRFVVLVMALGFVPALVLSWVYELTPEGIRREREVEREASITHLTAKRLDLFTIGIIILALGFILVDRLWLTPGPARSSPPAAVSPAGDVQLPDPALAETGYPSNSIAVLPFVNMSADADNEYFADGVSEELLNLLARIPELRVTSRSSSFYFKGKDVKATDIARELKVAHILEGSVRKAGDQVRITAQLIETGTDVHLWSETYDRKLDDIFAVQDDIAAAVTGALKPTLLGELPRAESVDTEAYTLYLKAQRVGADLTEDALEQSNAMLEQALTRDPGYARAWRLLARNYAVQAGRGMVPKDEGMRLAKEAIDRALELDPDFAEANSWLSARSSHQSGGDLAAAAKQLRRALSLEPGNVIVLSHAAEFLTVLGRLDQAIAVQEYIITLDPLGPISRSNLGWNYLAAGRPDDALKAARTLRMLSPDFVNLNSLEGMALLQKNETEAAIGLLREEPIEGTRLYYLALAHYASGAVAESDSALTELVGKFASKRPYAIAGVLACRNEADSALDWLEKAAQQEDPWLWYVVIDPAFRNMQEDPRWLPFLKRIGRSPGQLAAIELEVELPP